MCLSEETRERWVCLRGEGRLASVYSCSLHRLAPHAIQQGSRAQEREGGRVIKFSHNWKLDSSHNTHYRLVNIILIHLLEDPLEARFVNALPTHPHINKETLPVYFIALNDALAQAVAYVN